MKLNLLAQRELLPSLRLGRLVALASASALAASGFGGCASAAPYNPSNLQPAQLGQVASVCQNVMGLSPSEQMRPVFGAADNPDLTDGENYYQGCIASLSDFARSINHASEAVHADADCRASGMPEGSPALAECILRSQRASGPREGFVPITMEQGPGPARSFYSVGPGERTRREEEACARLGLSPLFGGFGDCVKELKDTFYSIDNPRG